MQHTTATTKPNKSVDKSLLIAPRKETLVAPAVRTNGYYAYDTARDIEHVLTVVAFLVFAAYQTGKLIKARSKRTLKMTGVRTAIAVIAIATSLTHLAGTYYINNANFGGGCGL